MSEVAVPVRTRSRRTSARFRLLRRLWADKLALAAFVVIGILVLAAVLAGWAPPHSGTDVDLLSRSKPPVWSGGTWSHPLGTDPLGRDMVSRLMLGARTTLVVGTSVVLLSATFGTLLGMIAGLRGGIIDAILMRLVEAQLAFPGLLLILATLSLVGPSLGVIILLLAIYGWMIYARMVRGIVLQLREEPFIKAARVVGASNRRILRRHVMPNLLSPLITQAMVEFARVVLAEASLSYLGLGIQPPTASWGLMVAENQSYIDTAWWSVVMPGALLAILVVSLNLASNWLRQETDPRQRDLRALGTVPARSGV